MKFRTKTGATTAFTLGFIANKERKKMQKYLFMKKSLNVLAAIVLSGAMLACSSDDSDGNSKTIRLRNHTESGCKDFASLSNITQSGYQKVKSQFDSNIIERVSLKGNKKGTLSIFHENATFPCEAEFTISVDVSESTIIVHEDAPPTTNCICHYDLNSEVGPLEDKTYTLIIKSEFAYGPTITHQFNYSSTLDESFVVTEEE
jgi:hypothetical protein